MAAFSLVTYRLGIGGWEESLEKRRGEIFTDGSKLGGKIGGGIFCKKLSVNLSLMLPVHCSVLQAEAVAVDVLLAPTRLRDPFGLE